MVNFKLGNEIKSELIDMTRTWDREKDFVRRSIMKCEKWIIELKIHHLYSLSIIIAVVEVIIIIIIIIIFIIKRRSICFRILLNRQIRSNFLITNIVRLRLASSSRYFSFISLCLLGLGIREHPRQSIQWESFKSHYSFCALHQVSQKRGTEGHSAGDWRRELWRERHIVGFKCACNVDGKIKAVYEGGSLRGDVTISSRFCALCFQILCQPIRALAFSAISQSKAFSALISKDI